MRCWPLAFPIAAVLALPGAATADGVMLIQAGALWMGRDGGPPDERPLPHGAEDLLGNLREWTSTILRPYPYNPADGREGFAGDGSVVVRGARHDDSAGSLSLTHRRSDPAEDLGGR